MVFSEFIGRWRAKKVLLLLALIAFPAGAETLVGAPPRTCFPPEATNSYVFSPISK